MPEETRRKRPADAPSAQAPYMSADERRAKGKALRDRVPRASQAGWKAQEGRRDPVDLLCQSNAGRVEELIPIRFGRMSASPFAFYRGAAALMAADLATTPTSGIRVQACGDAHLMNFGGFATPERNVIFDVNDLDETLPAPFEWDLKRLAASVVIAAQFLKLPDSDAARVTMDLVREYRERMADYAVDAGARRLVRQDRHAEVRRSGGRSGRRAGGAQADGGAGRGGEAQDGARPPVSQARHAGGRQAEDQGRSAADLSSDGRHGARPRVGLFRRHCQIPGEPARAHPDAVRPLSLLRPRVQGRGRGKRRHARAPSACSWRRTTTRSSCR